jgi:hypothetical protein
LPNLTTELQLILFFSQHHVETSAKLEEDMDMEGMIEGEGTCDIAMVLVLFYLN